jgi:hypothetical protein
MTNKQSEKYDWNTYGNENIMNHIYNLENKGLIGIKRPETSYWWHGTRDPSGFGKRQLLQYTIMYDIYPKSEPFDIQTWDLTKPECLNIYLNWYNDLLKTLKPEDMEFANDINKRAGKIQLEKFRLENSISEEQFIRFGDSVFEEEIGSILEYGFTMMRLNDNNLVYQIPVHDKNILLNTFVPYDGRDIGDIVRRTCINVYPSKYYAEDISTNEYSRDRIIIGEKKK